MQDHQNTVAHAFTLARSGGFRTVDDIRRELTKKGYPSVAAHLDGPMMKRQLAALIKAHAVGAAVMPPA